MSNLNKLAQATQDTLQYLWGGLARLFGPTDDEYPNTGVQPYSGDRPNISKRHSAKRH